MKLFLTVGSVLVLGSALAFASEPLDLSGPEIAFVTSATGGMKIAGKSEKLVASHDADSYRFVLSVASLDTGIDLRDDHMYKALESDKFPTVELTVPKSAVAQKASGEVTGQLKLHGQSRPVTVKFTNTAAGANVEVVASLKVNMPDFGIKTPSYLGIGVKPEVAIDVRFKAANVRS